MRKLADPPSTICGQPQLALPEFLQDHAGSNMVCQGSLSRISEQQDYVHPKGQVPNTIQSRVLPGVLAKLTHLQLERVTTGYTDLRVVRLEARMSRPACGTAMPPFAFVIVEDHLDPVTDQSPVNDLPWQHRRYNYQQRDNDQQCEP